MHKRYLPHLMSQLPSGRRAGRKRLPQVPHLISRNQPKPNAPLQHRFLSDTSQMTFPAKSHLPTLPTPDRSTVRTPNFQPTSSRESEADLDMFLDKCASLPVKEAVEVFFRFHYNAKETIFWEEIPDLQMLYANGVFLTHNQGLPGFCFFSRSVVRINNPSQHQAYDAQTDSKLCGPQCPVLLVPLWDSRNAIVGIVEVVRPANSTEFNSLDEEYANWFIRKYRLLSRWLVIQSNLDGLTLEILPLMRNDQFVVQVLQKVAAYFSCRMCDVWRLDKPKQQITRYGGACEVVDQGMAGIAGDALARENTVYCSCNIHHSSYNPDVDGTDEEAVLCVPVKEPNGELVYVVALRGPRNGYFAPNDVHTLKRAAPMILLGLENSETFQSVDDNFQSSRLEREGLAALLEVVEVLSSQLDTDKLTETIMEKGRMLTNADRCSLFLVNEARDRLITSLHQGLANCIDIPINKGIAGKTVTDQKILNIPDVYETEFFDPAIDKESGYRTKSILSVPIYNNRGEVIGVTEMVNKLDNKPFTQWDTNLIQIFNVFCGISLENAKLYRDSLEMSSQLRSFFDLSFTMSKSQNPQRVINDIMHNARTAISADRASVFMYDEGRNILTTFVSDGEKIPPTLPMECGIAGLCGQQKCGILENDPYHNPSFNRAIDQITKYKTESVIAAPVTSTDGKLLGVVEMLNKKNGKFVQKDLQIVSAFSTFASVVLENARLKDLAELGDVEIEMNKWISETEKKDTKEIPSNLVLTDEQKQKVQSLNFFSVEFKGINHFKELFFLFNHFHLLEKYEVTNEQFFRFIFVISSTYNQVPYHNWTHACDVTEYVSYEVITGGLDKVFTQFELFGLLTAAVCHDANHEGLNNVYNVKAETPFGILFKDQSVMEMHHVTVAIPIITRDDINLFHALTPDETKKMWNLFIKLILATDMAHHFELVKKAQGLCDEEKWTIEDPENRLLALQLLLKVGDISNVSRPFNIADAWCDILNNEFFRQGDLEKAQGIGLTSPLNDRENSNKPKSQIGFYNFICLPLYGVLARIFPPLQVNADSVKSNLEVWKSMVPPPPPPEPSKEEEKK